MVASGDDRSRPPAEALRVVPAQLPPGVRDFTGRARELAYLDEILDSAGEPASAVMIVALSGTAGIGKTALALHWAHRIAARFGDGQLYANLRGFDPGGSTMTAADALHGFLAALPVPAQHIPAGLEARIGLYRSILAGRRVLVVLDNAHDAEQVRPLLPGAPGCLVIVTSRNQLTSLVVAERAHALSLDLMSAAESQQLLTNRLGAARVAAEPHAVDEIVTGCARLPLALSIVAARAATHPRVSLAELAEEIRDARNGLDVLSGGDATTDVRAVFSWSYHTLSAGAARLFRLLGRHPGPDIGAPATASLAGIALAQVRPLLAELANAHLIVESAEGRYTYHELLSAYAAELADALDPAAEQNAAARRILDHYVHTAYSAALRLSAHREAIALVAPSEGVSPIDIADDAQALRWFTSEHLVLLAAIDQAASTGFDRHAYQLAWTLTHYLQRRGFWHDLAAIQHTALRAARRQADRPAQAEAHRCLGLAYIELGRKDDANNHLRRALHLFRVLGNQTGQANTHLDLAQVYERESHYRTALDHAQQALELFRGTGNTYRKANALNAVGWHYALLGEHRKTVAHCQEALALLQDLGERYGQAATFDSLGYAYRHLGDHARATACFRHALDLARELGDRYHEGVVLDHLGDAHHAAGDRRTARVAWQQALAILDEIGHPDAHQMHSKLSRLPVLDDAEHEGLTAATTRAPHRD